MVVAQWFSRWNVVGEVRWRLTGVVAGGVGYHRPWLAKVRRNDRRLMARRPKNSGAAAAWGKKRGGKEIEGVAGWVDSLMKVVEVIDVYGRQRLARQGWLTVVDREREGGELRDR
ncbi:hypothetical protein P3S67_001189 [Capsicum chacoense]